MNIDFDKIIRDFSDKASDLFNNREELFKTLEKALEKIKENKVLNSILSDFNTTYSLIKDYFSGEYEDISKDTIVKLIIGILYLLSPIDIIPDFLFGGFIDDLLVIGYILRTTKLEIEKYKMWKTLEKEDHVYTYEMEVKDLDMEDREENGSNEEVIYYEIKRED